MGATPHPSLPRHCQCGVNSRAGGKHFHECEDLPTSAYMSAAAGPAAFLMCWGTSMASPCRILAALHLQQMHRFFIFFAPALQASWPPS